MATQAVPVYVRMEPPDWTFSDQDLEKVLSPKTRGIMINTPANPSGKVFTHEELERLAAFAAKYDLFVFTDEIYEHFVYDGNKHIPPATLPGMKERTITISGLSKTFSITGWRVGYCICDARWAQTIGYFNDLVYVCAPAPLQMGVARGLAAIGEGLLRKTCQRICEQTGQDLRRSSSKQVWSPTCPRGPTMFWPISPGFREQSSKEKAMNLLRQSGVACVPGEAFYHDEAGENLARFCFAKEDRVLDEACRKIATLRFAP